MSDETRLAFAHPSERAKATAGNDPLDRISLADHEREVEIGAFQQERGLLQRVRFNVVVEVRSAADPDADDVDRILSYDTISEAIDHELQAERLNLLETLAARIAERILAHPLAARCFVRIEKLDRGPGALGVEIVRSRKTAQAPVEIGTDEDAPHPRVVFLSNSAIAAPHLTGWIDQLEQDGVPAIFCIGAPDGEAPRTGHMMTQRRIDLLAIEMNAWVLASKDPRCVVVNTRTELDWAMKNGQICVWAPSKIVLDAVDGPAPQPSDAVALAAWFAGEMQARKLWIIGGTPPETAPVPVRILPDDQARL